MRKEFSVGKFTVGFFAYSSCDVCKVSAGLSKIARVKAYRDLRYPKVTLGEAVAWLEANFDDKGRGHPLCGHIEKGG